MAAVPVDRLPPSPAPPPLGAPSSTAVGTRGSAPTSAPSGSTPPARRPLLVATGLIAATAVVSVFDPRRTPLAPPCPFRAVTGLDCPLCGGTRAVHDLVHLDLAAAAGQNLLVVALAPVIAVAVGAWVIGALHPTRWPSLRARLPRTSRFAACAGLGLVAFGVLRLLPFESLRWLRSG